MDGWFVFLGGGGRLVRAAQRRAAGQWCRRWQRQLLDSGNPNPSPLAAGGMARTPPAVDVAVEVVLIVLSLCSSTGEAGDLGVVFCMSGAVAADAALMPISPCLGTLSPAWPRC